MSVIDLRRKFGMVGQQAARAEWSVAAQHNDVPAQ
jgi:hypothetical protein